MWPKAAGGGGEGGSGEQTAAWRRQGFGRAVRAGTWAGKGRGQGVGGRNVTQNRPATAPGCPLAISFPPVSSGRSGSPPRPPADERRRRGSTAWKDLQLAAGIQPRGVRAVALMPAPTPHAATANCNAEQI
eukprot:353710-Chlamydomonas_euryale.AAC.7